MNQILAGSIALILGLLLWGIGKNPQKQLHTISKKNFLLDSNQSKISLIKPKTKPTNSNQNNESHNLDWKAPINKRERINLKNKLFKLMSNGPEERLYAVKIASAWGDRSVISIIKRGLKDSDNRIIIAAAKGIQKYRENPKAEESQLEVRPPRNVFLMR